MNDDLFMKCKVSFILLIYAAQSEFYLIYAAQCLSNLSMLHKMSFILLIYALSCFILIIYDAQNEFYLAYL